MKEHLRVGEAKTFYQEIKLSIPYSYQAPLACKDITGKDNERVGKLFLGYCEEAMQITKKWAQKKRHTSSRRR